MCYCLFVLLACWRRLRDDGRPFTGWSRKPQQLWNRQPWKSIRPSPQSLNPTAPHSRGRVCLQWEGVVGRQKVRAPAYQHHLGEKRSARHDRTSIDVTPTPERTWRPGPCARIIRTNRGFREELWRWTNNIQYDWYNTGCFRYYLKWFETCLRTAYAYTTNHWTNYTTTTNNYTTHYTCLMHAPGLLSRSRRRLQAVVCLLLSWTKHQQHFASSLIWAV